MVDKSRDRRAVAGLHPPAKNRPTPRGMSESMILNKLLAARLPSQLKGIAESRLPATGFEPVTCGLGNRRSIRLSYAGAMIACDSVAKSPRCRIDASQDQNSVLV